MVAQWLSSQAHLLVVLRGSQGAGHTGYFHRATHQVLLSGGEQGLSQLVTPTSSKTHKELKPGAGTPPGCYHQAWRLPLKPSPSGDLFRVLQDVPPDPTTSQDST